MSIVTILKDFVMRFLQRSLQVIIGFCRYRRTQTTVEEASVVVYHPHKRLDLPRMEAAAAFEPVVDAAVAVPEPPIPDPLRVQDADLFADPETLHLAEAKEMPPQIIEQWISAGLLYPDEVRAAEKLMRTMRNRGGENRKASS